ncbi:MAG: peptidase C69 [Candidatus Anoxymicrobium japonicum]|uniref:Peptidase C69 n=1 Tax=Candidatus Anoxymicrobium japonicum TaxID=2013648 RepID=A0A2N3G5P8_9ACTN|nr:MAG: peptidase C69 [Candidatus Anoxymicrobium japonicum]
MSVIVPDLALKAVSEALSTGGIYSDVICQRQLTTTIRFEDGKVDDVSSGVDAGAGVRVIKDDLAAYAHTDIIDDEHVLRAAKTAAEALAHTTGDVALRIKTPARKEPEAVCDRDTEMPRIADVVEHMKRCDEAGRGVGKDVRQVTVTHNSSINEELFANSLGETQTGASRRTRLIVQVVASRDGVMQVGQEAPGELMGSEFYRKHDCARIAILAARRALVMLDARPSPAGRMAVVMNAGTGGVLFHEACGHGLEIDHVHKGASVYAGKLGHAVASEIVSATDNPTVPGLWGSYARDDEGTFSRSTLLIENGILRNYLYDRHGAMKDGVPGTGNGRRQSFCHAPIPRMSNTYIEPGNSTAAEIIGSTTSGLYAAKMGGGQVDPVTGDYVFAVSEGYLIENGEVGPAVRGAVLIGNGPRTLEIIDAVGNDLAFEEGTCGKDGQGVPVTTGSPTFRIAELTVGGTEI